jgi:hypothetical protein
MVAAVIWAAACTPGTIPEMITDMEGFELPLYYPPLEETWGTPSARINHEGLNIKYSYKTSDDVIHIVLTGKISNGIPEGLLWNNLTTISPLNIPDAGSFGAGTFSTAEYAGYGDFRIGTVSIGEDTTPDYGTLSQGEGGSFVVALGSPDFSSEWVMGAPYSAIVISGLVYDEENLTITETNDSLHLLSESYRKKTPLPNNTIFITNSAGKLQKRTNYPYNPNYFDRATLTAERAWRGGYPILISERANPRTAFFEIDYHNSGRKRRIEVDYSGITLRQETPLTANVRFEDPPPPVNGGYNFVAANPTINGSAIEYEINDIINLSDIDVADFDDIPNKPLYLRPLYEPANIDPSKATTNMIKEIYLTDGNTSWGNPNYGAKLKPGDTDLVLRWDDRVQAITLNVYKNVGGPVVYASPVIINAELRIPFDHDDDADTEPIEKLTCVVNLYDDIVP